MTALKHFYETFQPAHYNLYIDVNRATKLISGTSTITGDAKETTVLIHQKFMTIKAVTADGKPVTFSTDNDNEAIHITLPQTGETTLSIDYTAPLTDSMMGIYPSYYELNGEKKTDHWDAI